MSLDVRREQLLDAGVGLFATRPYEDVSIDEIAEACGVSRGLLYHYFRGKRDYYVASIAHAADRLREVDPDPALPPTEQLRVGLDRYFATVEEHVEAYAAVRRAAAADAEIAQIVEEQRRAFAERVLAGMPGTSGTDASALVVLTARAWIGAVEAAAFEWIDSPQVERGALVTVLADALVAAMLAAVRADPSVDLPPQIAAVVGASGVADAFAAVVRGERAT
jgi:AcrR family transcriptional regulator